MGAYVYWENSGNNEMSIRWKERFDGGKLVDDLPQELCERADGGHYHCRPRGNKAAASVRSDKIGENKRAKALNFATDIIRTLRVVN